MPDQTPDRPTVSYLIPLAVMGATAFMCADFTAISLGPLKQLGMPYPAWMNVAHFIVPGCFAVLWLACTRLAIVKRWPNVAAIVTVLVCFQVSGFVCNWPEHMVARIPVTVPMDSAAITSMEPTCGFKVTTQGSNAGTFVIVALDHERAARDYLTKAALLRQPTR